MNLVERLRDWAPVLTPDSVALEAADEIERLTAERDALLDALCALVLNIDAGSPTLGAMSDARAAIDAARKA